MFYTLCKTKKSWKHFAIKQTQNWKKIVAEQSTKRKEIRAKIKELDKKRRKFVIEKQKSGTKKDELNSVMIQAIKRQAKLKNYSW